MNRGAMSRGVMGRIRSAIKKTGESAREVVIAGLEGLMFRADTTRFLIDSPRFDYQPIPWKGIYEAPVRGLGTVERWAAIKADLVERNLESLKDIGCCVGFFCISAAEDLGYQCIGFDLNRRFLRLARSAVPRSLRSQCHFLNMSLNPQTIRLVPPTDVTLCLSVWHHWYFHFGQAGATEILKVLWQRTNTVLYFETGEIETAEEFNLPFTSQEQAVSWISDYLNKIFPDARVSKMGEFRAGNYAHYAHKEIKRTLYKIERV